MNANALSTASMTTDAPPGHSGADETRLSGKRLALIQLGWLLMVVFSLALLTASLPIYYSDLRSLSAWDLNAQDAVRVGLDNLGISTRVFAIYVLVLLIISAGVWTGVGVLIAQRKSHDPKALYFSLTLITFGAIWPNTLMALVDRYAWLRVPTEFLSTYGFISFLLLFYLFPNGRFVPRWTRFLAIALIIEIVFHEQLPGTVLDSSSWPPPFGFISFIFPITMLYAQVYRYRRVSTPVEKQQTKWIISALAVALTSFLATGMAENLVIFNEPGSGAAIYALASSLIYTGAFLLIPIAVGVAILRYRLWDIDPIINRTLVYAALTTCIVGVYVIVVGWLGVLFRTGGNLFFSLLATGLVAILFQPLRERFQRGVNRLMYGERDEPYTVISRLGRRLEETLVPDTVLPTIVDTITEALKVPYAAIMLRVGDGYVVSAASGSPTPDNIRMPLLYQHQAVGELLVAPRAAGETFSSADRKLLEDLARQAGVAAHAVRLNTELQQARERLVEAREEERRRLRRDLHDGLGSQLAAINMQVGALRSLTPANAAAEVQVQEIRSDLRAAIASIRHIAHNLRPPALDEFGLLATIQARTRQYGSSGLIVDLDLPQSIPPLSAATEVAIYRIVEEALTNVARHSKADRCMVRLSIEDTVELMISDNGVGLSPDKPAGVGLLSMHERAEELGGTCHVESTKGAGTSVSVRLPLTGT